MEAYILDKNFDMTDIIDDFESFIWTDRYNSYGDFEIKISADLRWIKVFKIGNYMWFGSSEHLMIIENIDITTEEDGSVLIISGRSLESLLMRRVIWGQTNLEGNLQNAIKTILVNNIISPSDSNRKIQNFIFQDSSDSIITSLTIKAAQFYGEYVYDVIEAFCQNKQIGFKVVLNNNKQFVFSLYSGADRSYSQNLNPYVVFSPNFDNIMNSSYLESDIEFKNVALISGEGEGADKKTTIVGNSSGLERREVYINASDVSSRTEDGEESIPDTTYLEMLKERGNEELSKLIYIKTFEGEVDATRMFVYGKDFFMGDICQIVNEFGIEAKSRVGEIIFSHNEDGETTIPTFTIVTPSKIFIYIDGPVNNQGTSAFRDAVLLPNNKVLLSPSDSRNIGLYDIETNTYSDGPAHNKGFGAFGSAVLLPNNKVLLSPYNSPNIGLYDISTNTYIDGPAHNKGNVSFIGAVLMPNNKVLLVPYGSPNIGLYDIETNTYIDGPAHGKESPGNFTDGVLISNNKVLFSPAFLPNIGLYDIETNTYIDGPAHNKGNNSFRGVILLPNNKVLLAPLNSPNIGLYDIETNTYSDGPAHGKGSSAFWDAVLVMDDKVLLIPWLSSIIGLYDIETNTYIDGPAHGKELPAFIDGVLMPNDKVLLSPSDSRNIGLVEYVFEEEEIQ